MNLKRLGHPAAGLWSRSAPVRFLFLILGGTFALFAGILLIGALTPQGAGAGKLLGASPATLMARGYIVMALEAAVFTVVPIEAARRLWGRPLAGALVGAALSVIGVHWNNGPAGLAAASWIMLIVSGGYLLERPNSLPWAVALAVSLKGAFWTVALAALAASRV